MENEDFAQRSQLDLPAWEALRKRISPYIHRTPVLTCSTLDAEAGCRLFFKCENFQKIGAFKMRGAINAALNLPQEALARGLATHSSGNFAQAVALSAKLLGVPAYIVMPENAPQVKKDAVKGYGATVIECPSTQAAREAAVEEVVREKGATFLHPYNDWNVIYGQGTAAAELLEEVPDLDWPPPLTRPVAQLSVPNRSWPETPTCRCTRGACKRLSRRAPLRTVCARAWATRRSTPCPAT